MVMGAIKSRTFDESDSNILRDQHSSKPKSNINNNNSSKKLIKSSTFSSISSSSIIQPATSTSDSDKEEYIIVVNDSSIDSNDDLKKLSSQSENKIKILDEINNSKNPKQFKKDDDLEENIRKKKKMFRNASSTNYFSHNHVAASSNNSKSFQFTSFQPPNILQKSQYFRSFRSASRRLFGSNANTSKPNSTGGANGDSKSKISTEFENHLDQEEEFIHNSKSPYLNNLFKRSFKDINALRNLNTKLRNDFNNQANSNILNTTNKNSSVIKIRQLKSKSNNQINNKNQEQLKIPNKVVEEVEFYDNYDNEQITEQSPPPPPYYTSKNQSDLIKDDDFVIKSNFNKTMLRNSQKLLKNKHNNLNKIESGNSDNNGNNSGNYTFSSVTNSIKANIIDKLFDLKIPSQLPSLELKEPNQISKSDLETDLVDDNYYRENDKMIENFKRQIEQLGKKSDNISQEDFKILNELSEKVEKLAKSNLEFITIIEEKIQSKSKILNNGKTSTLIIKDYINKLIKNNEKLQAHQNKIEELKKNLKDVNNYYKQLQFQNEQYQQQQQQQRLKQQQQAQKQAADASYANFHGAEYYPSNAEQFNYHQFNGHGYMYNNHNRYLHRQDHHQQPHQVFSTHHHYQFPHHSNYYYPSGVSSMHHTAYGPLSNKHYHNSSGLYTDGISSFYAFYQPQSVPPPPPPSTNGDVLYFDQLTGQYFYQKSTHNMSQAQFYYDHMNGYCSNQSTNNIYAFYEDGYSQNANNSEEDEEVGSKTSSSNVIITEVSDEEDDEIEINIRNREKKKDYVDAISLNEEDADINNA